MHPCRSRGCKNIKGQSWRLMKNLPVRPAPGASVSNLAESAITYQPPTLTSDIFAASWPTRMYSTLFKRPDSYLFRDKSLRPCHDFLFVKKIRNKGMKKTRSKYIRHVYGKSSYLVTFAVSWFCICFDGRLFRFSPGLTEIHKQKYDKKTNKAC